MRRCLAAEDVQQCWAHWEERQFSWLVGGAAEVGIAYRGVVWERPLLVLILV